MPESLGLHWSTAGGTHSRHVCATVTVISLHRLRSATQEATCPVETSARELPSCCVLMFINQYKIKFPSKIRNGEHKISVLALQLT